ncbi:hypothetical protein FS749_004063 [Ceratobasidium sp. UAMH 11750]|nr:hypothetical protein FS749_004063 [Ceratobasidium sp. UAMH 11750]
MKSAVEHRPRITPELVRHVAEFSPLSSVLYLVLLNKACYRNTISVIYQVVTITSADQLGRFSHAILSGQSSLGPFTRSLYVRATGNYSFNELRTIPSDIHSLLLATENLTELTLDLYPSNAMSLLRNLSLDTNMVIGDPGVLLPNLRSLTAGEGTLSMLVPGRPISKICFNGSESISSPYLKAIISRISLASVPLVYLNISIRVHILAESAILLDTLSYSHGSLEDLTIRLSLSTAPLYTEPLSALDNLYNLGGSLRHFTALRKIAFESGAWALRFAALGFTALELRQFSSWKEICPPLESISLFGAVVPM